MHLGLPMRGRRAPRSANMWVRIAHRHPMFGLCGSMLVDFRVDVELIYFSEGRACRGREESKAHLPIVQNRFGKKKEIDSRKM
jgi:hypothetical protein